MNISSILHHLRQQQSKKDSSAKCDHYVGSALHMKVHAGINSILFNKSTVDLCKNIHQNERSLMSPHIQIPRKYILIQIDKDSQ